ncbi:MAG: flagellar biosynthesis protein FlhF, partial [Leptospira sp.]|nr:flagellar biosynthesis protein FlhF [Leptospira sp.]
MQFIKIRGKDIQDCFMQMKMKFGPEAHVYEHRVITEGGMFGSGFMAKKFYEIDVAIPEQQATKDRVERKIQDLKELLREKTSDASKKKTLKDMEGLVSKEKPVLPPELIKMPSLPPQVSVSSLREERKDLGLSLRDEIAKKEVPAKPNFAADSSNLVRFREKLIQEGMSTAYATEFTERLDLHLSLVERSKNSA